jgi:hypothetical protein
MAAGATFEPIQTYTLGSAASSITFSSIAASWTDLRVVFTGTTTAASGFWVRFNNDTSVLYSQTTLYGDGASAISNRNINATELEYTFMGNLNTTPVTFATLDLFSYAGSTFKTSLLSLSKDNNGSGFVNRYVGLYRSTTAVSRIDLIASGSFAIGTTATLYGIKAA